jgi:hypothetical protein
MAIGPRNSEPGPFESAVGQHAQHHRGARHDDRAQTRRACVEDRLVRRDALLAHLRDGVIDEEDAVLGDEAHEQDDADHRAHGHRAALEEERDDGSDDRQRQRRHDRRRVHEALELRGEHEVDEDEAEQERERHVRVRLVHHLDLAAPHVADAGRQGLLRDRGLELGDDVRQRSTVRRRRDEDDALALVVLDLGGPLGARDGGQIRERHEATRCGDAEVRDEAALLRSSSSRRTRMSSSSPVS